MQPREAHFNRVVRALTTQRVGLIPVLGAGVNLWARTREEQWQPGASLPDGQELAGYLARDAEYPPERGIDLARVSQWIRVFEGALPLYVRLRDIVTVQEWPLTPLHKLLARLPRELRDRGYKRPYQLLITTNYDDLLERAYDEAGEEYDLVVYAAHGDHKGFFLHYAPGAAEPRPIKAPNEYEGLTLRERSVILKIHGACFPDRDEQDSFVITEDHYIDYLAHPDAARFFPTTLLAQMMHSAFLFLGYGLKDWNVRVILRRLWGDRELDVASWAVQRDVDDLEHRTWTARGVELIDATLEEYTEGLERVVDELEGAPAVT
jgi:hypothetical protein